MQAKLSYWLLTTEYPPFFGGGISTYCFHTARMLALFGHHVTVFVADPAVPDYTVVQEKAGIRIIRFGLSRTSTGKALGHPARTSYEFAAIIGEFIKKEGTPDFLEAQDYQGIAYYILQYKHLLYPGYSNCKVVITIHSPAFLYHEYNEVPTYLLPGYWTGEMEKTSIRMADILLSPSQFIVDKLAGYFSFDLPANTHIVPNPYFVEEKVVSPSPAKQRISLFGKLSRQKGSFIFFEKMKKLWDEGLDIPVHVIGGTDILYQPFSVTMGQWLKRNYGSFIRSGKIVLEGNQSPAIVRQFLSNSDIVVVPSIIDNFPYTVVEAMAAGKIVLASDQGGQRELIRHGKNGFLFSFEGDDFNEQLQNCLQLDLPQKSGIQQNAMQAIAKSCSYEEVYQLKVGLMTRYSKGSCSTGQFPFLQLAGKSSSPGQGKPDNSSMLSVVIPHYNMKEYLEASVRSVTCSTYKNIEIIIVDDGSSEEGIEMFFEKLKGVYNFKLVRMGTNMGLAASRNVGAHSATGEYLAFLDADDQVLPDYYSRAIKVLNEYNNIHFVGCWVQYFGQSEQTWPAWTPEPPYFLVRNTLNSSSLVYKKSSFLEAGLNDQELKFGLEDYESVIHLKSKGYNGVVLPEPLFLYRVRENSMIQRFNDAKWLRSYQYIIQKHGVYFAEYSVEIQNLLHANGPGYWNNNPSRSPLARSNSASFLWMMARGKKIARRFPLLKPYLLQLKKVLYDNNIN